MLADVYQLTNPTMTLVPNPEKNPTPQHALEYMAVLDFPCLVLGRIYLSLGLWRCFRQAQDGWEGERARALRLLRESIVGYRICMAIWRMMR